MHRAAKDIGARGEARRTGDLFEKENGVDGMPRAGKGGGRLGDGVAEAFGGRVHRGPQAVVVVGTGLAARQIAGTGEDGGGDKTEAVVPVVDARLEDIGLFFERCWLELDMGNASAGTHPHAAALIRRKGHDVVVGQPAAAGEILAGVERRGGRVVAPQTAQGAHPNRGVGRRDHHWRMARRLLRRSLQGGGHGRIVHSEKGPGLAPVRGVAYRGGIGGRAGERRENDADQKGDRHKTML